MTPNSLNGFMEISYHPFAVCGDAYAFLEMQSSGRHRNLQTWALALHHVFSSFFVFFDSCFFFFTDSGRRGISDVVLSTDFYAFLLPRVCFCILHIVLGNLIFISEDARTGAQQNKYVKGLLCLNLIILSAIPAHCGHLLLMYPCIWKLCRDSPES